MSARRKSSPRSDGPWRLGLNGDPGHATGDGKFDEFTCGEWLHIEKMDYDHYWMRIGTAHVNVTFDRRGRVAKVMFEDAK